MNITIVAINALSIIKAHKRFEKIGVPSYNFTQCYFTFWSIYNV